MAGDLGPARHVTVAGVRAVMIMVVVVPVLLLMIIISLTMIG